MNTRASANLDWVGGVDGADMKEIGRDFRMRGEKIIQDLCGLIVVSGARIADRQKTENGLIIESDQLDFLQYGIAL